MNKYQEALNKIVKSSCPNCIDEKGCSSCDIEKICNATAKGWVNTLQELADKETPKKVKAEIMSDYVECNYVQSYEIFVCPVCGVHLSSTQNYCDKCGQKLDWSDEDE